MIILGMMPKLQNHIDTVIKKCQPKPTVMDTFYYI